MKHSGFIAAGILFLLLAENFPAQAGTKTWKAATTGDWFAVVNWAEGGDYPRAGDVVVITNAGASVLLTNSTEYLSSFTISNAATLVFSNWNTKLSATNVYIRTNANVTLPGAFTNNVMSNNVYFVCSNLTIDAGGSINADYLGYARGMSDNAPGNGPGASLPYGAAGYGGLSGDYYASIPYGSVSAPLDPGSGGRHGNNLGWPGGHGGGAVRIQATGTVLVNGLITANGRSAGNYGSYPGSGGGIYITCYTFAGTNTGANGIIRANGGACADSAGAGGGRIAVVYTNIVPSTAPVLCSVAGGIAPGGNGDIGTLYFPDTNMLSSLLLHTGQIIIPGFTNWSLTSLTVSNGWVRFPVENFTLAVANNLAVMGSSGKLELGGNVVKFVGSYRFIYTETNGPTLTCGSLLLTNGASLYLYGGRTNLFSTNCGAYVNVGGDVTVYTNCWIYPTSHPTNAQGVFFRTRSLTIVTGNAGINADTRGWSAGFTAGTRGYGPGGGGGGSYGGQGGAGVLPYGSVSAPLDPGSGGQTSDLYNRGGNGGGGIHIEATDSVLVNGVITANGGSRDGYNGGGGSGGGIYIVCNTLSGTNGLVSADGGYGQAGGGGGGRIAVIYTNAAAQNAAPVPDIVFSASGGQPNYGSQPGDIGTLYFPDNRFLTETIRHKGQWAVSGFTNWSPNNLTLTNAWIRFNPSGFRLAVSNQLAIVGTGAAYHKLELSNAWLTCGGNLTLANASLILYRELSSGRTLACGGNFLLTNNAVFSVYSGATNAMLPDYGALVDVTGNMTLGGANCWIYPTADSTNGGSVLFRMGNLTITSNSGFNADSYLSLARGYAANYGPGKGGGPNNAGGGYGGLGGGASTGYGQTYGSSNAPVDPGSGGTQYGLGGGSIRIVSSKTMTFGGTLTANGVGRAGYSTAGGSGGGVYVQCKDFAGTGGQISAIGGSCPPLTQGGGGGGGRIAVWRMRDQSSGCIATVAGGLAAPTTYPDGSPGTIVWGWFPAPGTWFVIH